VNVDVGTCYRLSAHIYVERLLEGLALEVWDADHGYAHWYAGGAPLDLGVMNWTPVSLQFCTGNDTQRIRVLIRYGEKGQGGKAWFDDIHLAPLDP
jgi:hypothetical protein